MIEKPLTGSLGVAPFGATSTDNPVTAPLGMTSGIRPDDERATRRAGSTGVADLVRSALTGCKRSYSEWSLKRKLEKEPENTVVLGRLGSHYELAGDRRRAADCFTTLAGIARRRRDINELNFLCRKLEMLACPHRSKVYRDLASLYGELGNHESAARACAQVVDLYIAEGHPKAAAGYLKNLPPLGAISGAVQAELAQKIALLSPATRTTGGLQTPSGATAPLRVTMPQQPLPEPPSLRRSTAELPPSFDPVQFAETSFSSFDDLTDYLLSYGGEVFLSGTLGRITQFDIVQMIESNSITGRLDITMNGELGAVFFKDGRIIASRYGSLEGRDAASRVFTIEAAPFRVIITDRIPPDEFHLVTNTGFLLDILKTEDEHSAERFDTSPLDDALFTLGD